MSYFYANRTDKNGNTLVTSYGNLKSAEKYGGADADISDTLLHAQFSDDFSRLALVADDNGGKNPVARSYMKNVNPPQDVHGKYVIWGKSGGVWSKTPFACSSYGAANTLMKSLLAAYESLVVVETDGDEDEQDMPTRFTRMALDNM